eukprot:scaffold57_cov254-Pinguiococcus_pyrenoidosus.AAC.51
MLTPYGIPCSPSLKEGLPGSSFSTRPKASSLPCDRSITGLKAPRSSTAFSCDFSNGKCATAARHCKPVHVREHCLERQSRRLRIPVRPKVSLTRDKADAVKASQFVEGLVDGHILVEVKVWIVKHAKPGEQGQAGCFDNQCAPTAACD